jgi:hypothetical protein
MNETQARRGMARFLWDNLRLQAADFRILPAVVAGAFVLFQLLFVVIRIFSRDPEALTLGIPGLIALVVAGMSSVVQSAGRFSMEYRVGVCMSRTRREMLCAGAVLSLLNSAVLVAAAAACNGLWALTIGRMPGAENILAQLPAWGWAAAWYGPAAAGMLAGAILLRFGRRGFWGLYAIFMLCMLGPQLFGIELPAATAAQLLAVLPWLLPAASAASAAAGWALLRAAPLPE